MMAEHDRRLQAVDFLVVCLASFAANVLLNTAALLFSALALTGPSGPHH
jgi:hypothetical protein